MNVKHKSIFIALSLLLIARSAFSAVEVVVTGYGADKNAAINDAKRNAISTVVGEYIDSQTLVDNFQMVEDRIMTSSSGFVTAFDILSEGNEFGSYRVQIKATVETQSIRNNIDAIKVLSAKRGDPRFIVVPDPNPTSDAFRPNDPACGEALNGINEFLAERGINVVRGPDYYGSMVTGSPDMLKDLSAYAANLGAEYAVYFSVVGKLMNKGRTFGGRSAIAQVQISVVHTGSYRIVASSVDKTTTTDQDDIEFAYRKAARQAAKKCMGTSIDMVLADWSRMGSTAGATYNLTLRNINDKDLGTFQKALSSEGKVKSVNMQNYQNNTATLVVTIDGSTSMLSASVSSVLNSNHWNWALVKADGSSLTYEVPSSITPTQGDSFPGM